MPKDCGARSIYPGVGADIDRGSGYTLPSGSVIPTIFPGVLGEEGAKKLTKQQLRFFMPRIGIAFRPTEKTVIRMGAGWFDNIQHLNTFTIFNLMPPKAGSQAYQTSYVAAQSVPVNAANGQTINLQTFRYAPTLPSTDVERPVPDQHRWSFCGASYRRGLPSSRLQRRRCMEVELRCSTRTAMERHCRRWIRRLEGIPHRQLGYQLE